MQHKSYPNSNTHVHVYLIIINCRSILTSLSKDGYSSLESQASLSILNYIRHTQRSLVPFLRPPLRYSHTNHVTIDARTRRSLELVT